MSVFKTYSLESFACRGMNLASGPRDGEVAVWSLRVGKKEKE